MISYLKIWKSLFWPKKKNWPAGAFPRLHPFGGEGGNRTWHPGSKPETRPLGQIRTDQGMRPQTLRTPPNPPFWIKYGSKWKIGFLLKTRIRLGFYISNPTFRPKPHKKIILIPLDSTGPCPKRTPMVPETHRYSSQKFLRKSRKNLKIP